MFEDEQEFANKCLLWHTLYTPG